MVETADILSSLEVLVAADTRNPPRNISPDDSIFEYLQSQLNGFAIKVEDLGEGSLGLLATRGAPRTIFNFHLDTVPDTDGWTKNPFELRIDGDRAIGLGACDIKGARRRDLTVPDANQPASPSGVAEGCDE